MEMRGCVGEILCQVKQMQAGGLQIITHRSWQNFTRLADSLVSKQEGICNHLHHLTLIQLMAHFDSVYRLLWNIMWGNQNSFLHHFHSLKTTTFRGISLCLKKTVHLPLPHTQTGVPREHWFRTWTDRCDQNHRATTGRASNKRRQNKLTMWCQVWIITNFHLQPFIVFKRVQVLVNILF